jgi:starch synthase
MASAIDAMFEDSAKAEAMGKAGYARARDLFSWERIAEETLEVYNRALQGRRQ